MNKWNKWVVISVIAILAIGTITNWVFYIQETNKLKDTELDIAALQEYISAVEDNVSILEGGISTHRDAISSLESNTSILEGGISTLGDGISALGDGISTLGDGMSILEGNLSTVEGSVSVLDGDVSALEGNVSTLEGDVSAVEGKVSTVEGKVSTVEGKVSAIEGDVSTLEGDVSALEAYDRAIMDVVALVQPSVVRIVVNQGGGWYGQGSGVIVSSDGYVLTNAHVVEDAISVEITLMSGVTYDATIVAEGAVRDLAILKIVSARTDFPEAVLGSSDDIAVGERVVAIGYPNPFEIYGQATFTTGIVSAVRIVDGFEYVQTDAAVNKGNSGGPLVNLRGEVIGINTWGFRVDVDFVWEGLNFAIPIDAAKLLIQDNT